MVEKLFVVCCLLFVVYVPVVDVVVGAVVDVVEVVVIVSQSSKLALTGCLPESSLVL